MTTPPDLNAANLSAPASDASIPDASTLSAPISAHNVRSLFARPARLERADFLRAEIASRMFERLDLVKLSPERVLDAGCGVGKALEQLQQRYPAAQVVGVDASVAMAVQANGPLAQRGTLNKLLGRLMPSKGGVQALCGDFGNLPMGPNSVDMVWSNLALHWHPQPDVVFTEWRRVLRNEGLLMFSSFGPDSLRELRTAFAVLDSAPHVLPFVDMHDFGDQLAGAGFSTPVMDMEVITVTYDRVQDLLADTRALGGNPLATRRRGLIGRQAWQRVLDALEKQRNRDGKLTLTFEVIYGHAFRPAPKVTAAGEAIVRFMPRKG